MNPDLEELLEKLTEVVAAHAEKDAADYATMIHLIEDQEKSLNIVAGAGNRHDASIRALKEDNRSTAQEMAGVRENTAVMADALREIRATMAIIRTAFDGMSLGRRRE